jgi:hypothetical protein
MKARLALSAVTCLLVAVAGCKKKEAKKTGDDSALSGNPAMAPLDYLAAQGKAKKFAERTISAAELTSAIQKFNAMEDRYPRDLNELVQQRYLQAAPAAPAGRHWDYNPQTGAIRLVMDTPAQPSNAPAPPTKPRSSLPGPRNLPQQPVSTPGE